FEINYLGWHHSGVNLTGIVSSDGRPTVLEPKGANLHLSIGARFSRADQVAWLDSEGVSLTVTVSVRRNVEAGRFQTGGKPPLQGMGVNSRRWATTAADRSDGHRCARSAALDYQRLLR